MKRQDLMKAGAAGVPHMLPPLRTRPWLKLRPPLAGTGHARGRRSKRFAILSIGSLLRSLEDDWYATSSAASGWLACAVDSFGRHPANAWSSATSTPFMLSWRDF